MWQRFSVFTVAAVLALRAVAGAGEACPGFGPQSPRDIDLTEGLNPVDYGRAPPSTAMNLCNIHLHRNAEHRAAAYSTYAGDGGDDGIGGGYECTLAEDLTPAERARPEVNHCQGLQPGDTIEVHWVLSSCDVSPGPGLGACASEACVNPTLQVEAQVFTLVNDSGAMDFMDLAWQGHTVDGRPQPRALPADTGAPVKYHGSTTGPKYSGTQCSPYQVHWSVRPQCAKLDINSLSRWCANNDFEETGPHGVRALVINPELLAPVD